MKKHIFVLLSMNSIFINAMQMDLVYLTSFPLKVYVSSIFKWVTPAVQELSLIEKLYVSKDKFEEKLKVPCKCINEYKEKEKMHPHCLSATISEISMLSIDFYPEAFLRYCYYQKLHEKHSTISIFSMFDDRHAGFDEHEGINEYNKRVKKRFEGCLAARMDDYSVLGASMIAQHRTLQERCTFIQALSGYGFKPTLKDIQLAELILYNAIIENGYKELFIHLLHNDSSAHWNVLIKDVRQLIAQILRALYKKDYWLLPGL